VLEKLTAREREVLALIAAGKSTKELASELGIAFKTACCHRSRILNKLDAHNTAELLRNALERGLFHWSGGQSVIAPGGAVPSKRTIAS
jgi:DNA-binding NarL/FixJ family response regulator